MPEPWPDLRTLVDAMLAVPTVGRDLLAAAGGRFPQERLQGFVDHWGLPRKGMPWSVWEWTDDIRVDYSAGPPGELDYLERGRLFGIEGDLDLRRDGDAVLWRFVGSATVELPAEFPAGEYWQGKPEGWRLRPFERTALLWGREAPDIPGVWREPRVGWARLHYPPCLSGHGRVRLRYREYLRGGNVELVWLQGLEPAPEEAPDA